MNQAIRDKMIYITPSISLGALGAVITVLITGVQWKTTIDNKIREHERTFTRVEVQLTTIDSKIDKLLWRGYRSDPRSRNGEQ